MLKLIRKFYYKLKIEQKLRDFEVQPLLDILTKYDKFVKKEFKDFKAFCPYCFMDEAGTTYDIFYKNIHIYRKVSGDDWVTRISLKKEDESWMIGESFSEANKTMEVFLTYNIEVLGNLRCNNTVVKDGNWNEYVYKTLEELEGVIKGYTIESEFNNEYDYSKKCKSGE